MSTPRKEYEYDITQPPPEDDPSFLEHLQQHKQSEDAKRDLSNFDGSSVRSMTYAAARWANSPRQKRFLTMYSAKLDEKNRIGKAVDIEKDVPTFWEAAQREFPLLATKSPMLLKLAITEGNTEDFKRSLHAIITMIDAAKKGDVSVPDCSEALREGLYQKYSRQK
jgi:hypothetical protein